VYLLYVDESGQHGGNYFVLAGVGIFERQTYWLGKEFDGIQREFLPDLSEPVDFHAAVIRARKEEPWCRLTRDQAHQVLDSGYAAIARSKAVLFAVAVDRAWLKADEDPYLFAFESLVKKFEDFLHRLYLQGNEQRGLVIIAESQYRERIEALAESFRREGTRWGELYNLCEIPLFTPASRSRLLQAADFCANAVYGRYESKLTRHFDTLSSSFDNDNGVIHGLSHFSREYDACTCTCPACLSRRLRHS